MAIFQLLVIAPNGAKTVLDLDALQLVPVQAGATYQLVDANTQALVRDVVLKKDGEQLVVEHDGQIMARLDGFFASSETPAVFDVAGDGQATSLVTPDTPAVGDAQIVWQAGGDSAMSGLFVGTGGVGYAGVAALGGVVVAASQAESAAVNTVLANVVAGPVLKENDLWAYVYSADGSTLLGDAKVDPNGQVSIEVGSYQGVVIVKVQNDDGLTDPDGTADYLDEATSAGKDLGNVALYSVGEIVTTNGTTTLNVNLLTGLAHVKALDAANGSDLTNIVVSNANSAVAQAFGLDNLANSIQTIVDVDGNAQTANLYGQILAALSGMDQNNGGDVKATLEALSAGITMDGATAAISSSLQEAIGAGANAVDSSGALFNTLSDALDLATPEPAVTEPTVTAPNVTDANISISGAGVDDLYEMGETVTVTWNNTSAGDNNSDISAVTVDFSAFGGGSAVAASDDGSGNWTASYTLDDRSVHGLDKNVTVTATNSSGGEKTTADTSDGTVIDTTVVVFDFVNGDSSYHSDRLFEASVDYTIYFHVNSTNAALNTSGNWGNWNAEGTSDLRIQLGANSKIFLVGNGAQIVGMHNKAGMVGTDVLGGAPEWLTALPARHDYYAAALAGAQFARYYDGQKVQVKFVATTAFVTTLGGGVEGVTELGAAGFGNLTKMPDLVMTTQGLA